MKVVCEAVFGSTKGGSVVDPAEMRKGHAQGKRLETKMLSVRIKYKCMIFKKTTFRF